MKFHLKGMIWHGGVGKNTFGQRNPRTSRREIQFLIEQLTSSITHSLSQGNISDHRISDIFADAFERLRNMVGLDIRCRFRYSQAYILQNVKVGTFTPPSPCDGVFTSEGVEEGSTLMLCGSGVREYEHLTWSSSIFLISLSHASANFQRGLKFYGPRCSFAR